MCISLTMWTTTSERAQMVYQPILIVGQLMEASVPHSAEAMHYRGNALYSSLWRSAMRSLVLFLTFVSYFQEQWGLLCLPLRASPEGIVGSEVGSAGGLVRYIGSGIFTTILFLPSPVCPFFNLSSLCSTTLKFKMFFFFVRCIMGAY